jgi:hypothetical protein
MFMAVLKAAGVIKEGQVLEVTEAFCEELVQEYQKLVRPYLD